MPQNMYMEGGEAKHINEIKITDEKSFMTSRKDKSDLGSEGSQGICYATKHI